MTIEPQKLTGQLAATIPAVGPVAPTLTFGGKKPLTLRTGMNAIEWTYELKTQSKATYGGEVVQVLGASVGPIRISGSTQSRQEYEIIRKWITEVMRALGTGNRRETPIIFNYAERDWSFQIIPIEFGPWTLDDKLVGVEWFLTAEVVSPTASGLVESTMSGAGVGIPDSTLLADKAYEHWRNHFDPAFADGYFPTLDEVEEQGNSMDRMLASLARGAFDLFGRPEAATDEPDDVYEEITGSKWIRPPASEALAGVVGEPGTLLQKVALIVSTWEAADMPARLGVATALGESTSALDENIFNGTFMGLFQTNPDGRGADGPNAAMVREAYNAVKDRPAGSYPEISEAYPASAQIEDAASWTVEYRISGADKTFNDKARCREWAENAQGTRGVNNTDGQFIWWDRTWAEAEGLIEQARSVTSVVGPGQILPDTYPGSPVPGQQPGPPTHNTDGLNTTNSARDYFAATGSPCVSPYDGVVSRLSGRPVSEGWAAGPGSAFGLSVYIDADNGKSYYLTHLGERTVEVGQRVRQGEQIGTLAPLTENGNNSHIHQDPSR